MNISELTFQIKKPPIYSPGTDFMWTHPHISKQLLSIHLDPDIDLASRRQSTIETTIKWIERQIEKTCVKILDLGCGPGLYCERLAHNGHLVSGVDISENSVSYAKDIARRKSLEIDYICEDYKKIDFEDEQFDIIIMIFADFGVLNPLEQRALLKNVFCWLKPGGKFIFDVMAISGYEKMKISKTWEFENYGFWREKPYLHLSESVGYDDESVILSQHVVMDDEIPFSVYRFWTHYFSSDKIYSIFKSQSYSNMEIYNSVLPDNEFYSGEDVYFVIAEKK